MAVGGRQTGSTAQPIRASDRPEEDGRRFLRFLAPAAIVSLLVGLTVAIFWRQLFSGWTFPYDFLGPYSSTPGFVAATIGRLNPVSFMPFVASGFPVAVDPQSGLYFPVWWVLGFLRVPVTVGVVTGVQVAHVLFGALGVLALARARRLPWQWAALAAVGYLFFGGFYGQAEHADYVRGFAYAPWLLWTLTPPAHNRRWSRLAALPLVAWLVVAGGYPGQTASFALVGIAYLVVELRLRREWPWRTMLIPLVLAAVACAGITLALTLPYIEASSRGELIRLLQPTVSVRATWAIHPLDALGLYLNNFAWDKDGTIAAWAVGIPALIGVACVRRRELGRQASLAIAGGLALVLGMSPAVRPIGELMTLVRPLFPTRFPAADYKAFVAIALLVLGAEGWRRVAARRGARPWSALALGLAIVVGAIFAPSAHANPTDALALVIGGAAVCVLLALLRPRSAVLVGLLLVAIVIDGAREIDGYVSRGIRAWGVPASHFPWLEQRDTYVSRLPYLLAHPPAARPARTAPFKSLEIHPTGTEPDAAGWVGDGYHLTDYGSTIENVRFQAEHNLGWTELLLAPWSAYTWSCATVGCASGDVSLPPPDSWIANPSVRTISYGPQRIVYAVNLPEPVLLVENELAIRGWHANRAGISVVNAGIPLRAWRLPAGRYEFTASYTQPGQTGQLLAVLVALSAWMGCVVLLRMSARRGAATGG